MPLSDYTPQFPYKENQIILTSDRVLLHSKRDSIFLFGKQAVSLSTTGTVNVDANKGMSIAAPAIELGIDAKQSGHPLIKTKDFVVQLERLFMQLEAFASAMEQIRSDGTGLSKSIPAIVSQAELLKSVIANIRVKLPDTYSTTTYTN